MQVVIHPATVNATVMAPASKSAMQRACAAALIKTGVTVLKNPGASADDKAALQIIQHLGASVTVEQHQILINSRGIHPVAATLNCGESGLSVRMFTPISAVTSSAITVTGSGSLKRRPLSFFNNVLPVLGVGFHSNSGYLPLQVKGPLLPKDITVDGSLSSQFLTGLLLAYAAAGAQNVCITVKNLNSTPYVDLTLQLMEDFGLATPLNENYERFYFGVHRKGNQIKEHFEYTVEGDWSGAAFLLVAGAIAGNISVLGLNAASAQADKAILQALVQAGANVCVKTNEVKVSCSAGKLKCFYFDATHCPDLFPPLVALAACCEGTTSIEGVSRLQHKESNRALTLQQEFGKMGVTIHLHGNAMLVEGSAAIKAARVHSHHDHRIAMACAVAALKAQDAVTIDVAEAVNKSYPQFWQHLQCMGCMVQYQ